MNDVDNKKVKDLIHSIGLMNNLVDKDVKEIVESQFRFTYKTIRELNFEGLTDEEIDNLRTNFYFKYIGKIYTDSEIIKRSLKRDEIVKQKYIEKNEKRD